MESPFGKLNDADTIQTQPTDCYSLSRIVCEGRLNRPQRSEPVSVELTREHGSFDVGRRSNLDS